MPGNKCAINSCKAREKVGSRIKLHIFPWNNKDQLAQWIAFVKNSGTSINGVMP